MPICRKCGNEFPNKMMIDGKKRVLNSRKYCLECSPFNTHNTKVLDKEKDLQYIQKRRKQLVEAVNRRRVKLKQMAVEYKGGKCCLCGYDKCIGALEFHHLDPSQKSFAISKTGTTRSWEKVRAELDKCVLLCANCHREVEAGVVKV